MIFDLAIIGGGPAGCAAAIVAARKGARVLLLECARFPRHKVCGEFVSAESLEFLRNLLANDPHHLLACAPRISSSRIFLDGSMLEARIDPPAASIPRFNLDAALWETCCLEGVEARAETVVKSIEGNGPFQIKGDKQAFEADAVINAGGRWSSLTSAEVRARNSGDKWIGIKAHFYESSAVPSTDLYFFDGGYCGVQPVTRATNLGTRINACAMVRADVANTLSAVLRLHPALQERSRTWKPAMGTVSTSPLIFHKPEPVQNTMLQVGDAAAFADPFVGDGISLALRSGALAAECLQSFFAGKCSLQQTAALYSQAYKERLGRVFKVSSMLRGWLRWPRPIRKPVFSLISRADFIGRQMVKLTR
ncbi:MAG TPA: FAD-dependent oxidoreductase [Terriglobales bacterium]|nr:FAD-dependent oxidoreductase [Terriglobales bacterium]